MVVCFLSAGTMALVVLVAFSSWLAPAFGEHPFKRNIRRLCVIPTLNPTCVRVRLLLLLCSFGFV